MKTRGFWVASLLLLGTLSPLAAQVEVQQDTTNPATWSGLDMIYTKDHIANKKPIPYPSIREADIMWSKLVWRKIDMREKMNQPLYFPTKPMGNRMSLTETLMHAVENGELTAYATDDQLNEFRTPISYNKVLEEFDAQDIIQEIDDVLTGMRRVDTIAGEIRLEEVQQLLIKEVWFFDRKRSVLDVRIIGLCPIRLYYKADDYNKEDLQMKQLFWVKYPEAREILAKAEVNNQFNDAEMRSFDEIFYKRFFDSFVVRESNVYNNRMINEYSVGMESLLEGERIEDLIFKFEHDLWEY